MPKGRRFKRYLLKGLMKVVRGCDSGVIRICQNPDQVSSFVKTLASGLLAFVCLLSCLSTSKLQCPTNLCTAAMNTPALSPLLSSHVKLSSFKNYIVFSYIVLLKCRFYSIIFLFIFISHWQNSENILCCFSHCI